MIEINFVPITLRKKRKSHTAVPGAFSFSQEAIVGLAGGMLVLLFVIHFLFQLIIFTRFVQLKMAKNHWGKILPDKAKADAVIGELRGLQNKISTIDKLKSERKISWAQKLNDISDNLPRGVWLNKLSLNEKVLLIDGSSVSKTKDEMSAVGNFVSNLKGKQSFMVGLQNLELGSVQRRPLKVLDLVDFVISVKLQ